MVDIESLALLLECNGSLSDRHGLEGLGSIQTCKYHPKSINSAYKGLEVD